MHRSWAAAVIVLAVVAALVWSIVLRPGSPVLIRYYEIVDEDTIVIGVGTSGEETRVTEVNETDESVIVKVREFLPLVIMPGGVGEPMEFTVDLQMPLGDREVRDATHVVRRQGG